MRTLTRTYSEKTIKISYNPNIAIMSLEDAMNEISSAIDTGYVLGGWTGIRWKLEPLPERVHYEEQIFNFW